MVVRICSQFRPGEKAAKERMKGILPIAAIPLATPAKFCSATPTSKNLSGNFLAKLLIQTDSFKFAVSATTRWSFSPANTNPSPNPVRVDFSFTCGLNILTFFISLLNYQHIWGYPRLLLKTAGGLFLTDMLC